MGRRAGRQDRGRTGGNYKGADQPLNPKRVAFGRNTKRPLLPGEATRDATLTAIVIRGGKTPRKTGRQITTGADTFNKTITATKAQQAKRSGPTKAQRNDGCA